MIISAHQPAYLPWLGYFDKIISSDIFIILDDVQFEKNSFINRNKIKTPQGNTWITVPVNIKGHTNCTIKDIQINNQIKWREQHWKNILYNYKKTVYFEKYYSFFYELYQREWTNLNELLNEVLLFLLDELEIKTKIYFQKDLGITGHKQDLIINLCEHFKADTFIFGQQGRDYVDEMLFVEKGIKPIFQNYRHPQYNQVWGEFEPYMSIIDLLFNEGPEYTKKNIYGS